MRTTGIDAPGWSPAEIDLLVRAARHAPLYGGGRPWVLEPRDHEVALFELPHRSCHDRLGFGRLLTCGAVLQNVVTALRAAGWLVEVDLPADVDRPDLLAVLTAVGRREPTAEDLLDDRALEEEGAPGPVAVPALVAADHWPGTRVRPVDGTIEPAVSSLPAGSTALLVSTDGDSRRDVLRAGAALQAVRLRARASGLRTSFVRGPLHGTPGHHWALLGVRPVSPPRPEG